MKNKKVEIIEVSDFDNLVSETYNRVYDFQQQDDCKDRGFYSITVPCTPEDYKNDTIPETLKTEKMGVSFNAWLSRDPNKKLKRKSGNTHLWWSRNFYPHVSMIINDLHEKGLLEKGEYLIEID